MEAWDFYRGQLYLGMPLAMPSHHLDQVARYGFRGWRGALYGQGRGITDPGVNRLKAYAGKNTIQGWGARKALFLEQVLGGGRGSYDQIMGRGAFGPKAVGAFGLTISEQAAITETIKASKTQHYTKATAHNAVRKITAGVIQTSESMTLGESITGIVTGRNAKMGQALGSVLGSSGVKLSAGSMTRRASLAAFAGVGLKPLLGIWNVATIGLIAAQVGEGVVRMGMHAMKSIQQYSMGIPRLDMGGDVSSFHTGLATTERQRAIQAIQGGMYNARMAIGNEAAFLHS